MDKTIKLHIQDGTFAHCEFSNNPLPPKQRSKYISWERSGRQTQNTCVYTEQFITRVRKDADNNIGWLIEPRALISGAYQWLELNHQLFEKIWTHDRELIKACSNATLVPFGGCWIDEEDWKIHPKSKEFSIIASGKNTLPGHILRHQIVAAGKDKIDVFGNGYKEVADKIDGLGEYRYHFSVENCRTDYWFTEKLIDCFRTGTVPIYWGCPSIGDFFNTRGMICFEKLEDLPELLKTCNEENYHKMMPAIQDNFERSAKYILAEDWMVENGVLCAP